MSHICSLKKNNNPIQRCLHSANLGLSFLVRGGGMGSGGQIEAGKVGMGKRGSPERQESANGVK